MRAEATFEITSWDQSDWDESPAGTLGRARVGKRFTGDLDGESLAEVLMAGTPAGPAAYTAQERFTGTFAGRAGAVLFQHSATSLTDGSRWTIIGGSDGLTGITGDGVLEIADGVHRVTFDYELPSPA